MRKQGFIKTILVIVVALIILGYFNINFKTVVKSPMVQANLSYGWDIAKQGFEIVKDKAAFLLTNLKNNI